MIDGVAGSSVELSTLLTSAECDFVWRLSRFASLRGALFYLVGGAVRNVLLRRPAGELDFVTMGEISELLPELKRTWADFFPGYPTPIKILQFSKYRTGKLLFDSEVLPGMATIDFSSARRETYAAPGARPLTSAGTLEEDFHRRDFSVNALALLPGLDGRTDIIDVVRGREDLGAGLLRVLHERSFLDDPMRIIRAARFATRFGFSLETETSQLLSQAVRSGALQSVFPQRQGTELVKALKEDQWQAVLALLESWGVLELVAPGARVPGRDVNVQTWEERFVSAFSGDLVRSRELARSLELKLTIEIHSRKN